MTTNTLDSNYQAPDAQQADRIDNVRVGVLQSSDVVQYEKGNYSSETTYNNDEPRLEDLDDEQRLEGLDDEQNMQNGELCTYQIAKNYNIAENKKFNTNIITKLDQEKIDRYIDDDDKEYDAEGKEDLSAEGHLFSSVPIVLVAGGTDLNGYGVRRMPYKKVQKSDREKMIARSLKAADAVVLFNSALLSRAKEMLDDPVVANCEANHAPFTSTTTIPTFDNKAEDTQADYSSDMPPASASKHCNCLVVIPQSVDVTGIAGQWLRHRLGIAATDMLLLLPPGIRPVKDPLFLASE